MKKKNATKKTRRQKVAAADPMTLPDAPPRPICTCGTVVPCPVPGHS